MANKSDKYDEHGRCRTCRSEPKWDDKWDCAFCPKCVKWLESKCSDPTCNFCRERPQRPRMNKEDADSTND